MASAYRLGEQQAGHVGACNEQDKTNRSRKDQERRTNTLHNEITERLNTEDISTARREAIRKFASELLGCKPELCVRHFERLSGFEAPYSLKIMNLIAAVEINREWHPNIGYSFGQEWSIWHSEIFYLDIAR